MMIGEAGAAAAPPGPAEFPAAMAHPPGRHRRSRPANRAPGTRAKGSGPGAR